MAGTYAMQHAVQNRLIAEMEKLTRMPDLATRLSDAITGNVAFRPSAALICCAGTDLPWRRNPRPP